MEDRKKRQREFEQLDQRLQEFHKDHPWQFRFLALGLAIAIFEVAMLIKILLTGGVGK